MSSPALGMRGMQQRVVWATSSRKLTYKSIGLRRAHSKRQESFSTSRPSCNAHAIADQVHVLSVTWSGQEPSVYLMIKVGYVRFDLELLREKETVVLLPSRYTVNFSVFKVEL